MIEWTRFPISIHIPHTHITLHWWPAFTWKLGCMILLFPDFLDFAMFYNMYSFWIMYRMFLYSCIYTRLFDAYHVSSQNSLFYFWQLNSRSHITMLVVYIFQHAMLVHFLGCCKLLHTLYNTCTFTFLSAINSCDILYFAHLYFYRISSVYLYTASILAGE